MIAGDWPSGAARNLIKSPPGTSERPRARVLAALSIVPTCTRVIHVRASITNASRIRARLPADLISCARRYDARAVRCERGEFSMSEELTRREARPKQSIRDITIVNHQGSRYSLNDRLVHRTRVSAPLPIKMLQPE